MPDRSGKFSTLNDVAKELSLRLARIFLRTLAGAGRYSEELRSFSTIRIGATY